MSFKRCFSLLLFFSFFLFAKTSQAAIPAFPGAEGFGANTPGGRGGKVFLITSLDDSGSGSFRSCAEASGPRICVFKVAGTITMNSDIDINSPFITIAGQTAPGGGITLKRSSGTSESFFNIGRGAHDVVIRYIRVRPGTVGGQPDGIGIYGRNVIIDHSSVSWAVDENMSTWYDAQNITIQWSITSEGLHCSTHPKGCHSMGLLLGSSGSGNISVHHNLFVHNNGRNPRIKTSGTVDVVNNVIYNPAFSSGSWGPSHITGDYSQVPVNYVANFYKAGPNSGPADYYISASSGPVDIYVKGNITPKRPSDNLDEIQGVVRPSEHNWVVSTRHSAPSVTTSSAFDAYDQVLAQAGATLPVRDSVDRRIVNDVKNGTGRIIDDPSEVGGWPSLAAGTPYADSDHDGMADDWERINFGNLNRGSASDSSSDYDNDGYTDLEEFFNGTNPKGGGQIPTQSPTPGTNVPGDANDDEIVNQQDYDIWLNNYNTETPSNYHYGDFNINGFVDGLDYIIWLNNYSM